MKPTRSRRGRQGLRTAAALAALVFVLSTAPRADTWVIGLHQSQASVTSAKVTYLNIVAAPPRQDAATAQTQISYLNVTVSPPRQDAGSAFAMASYLNIVSAPPRVSPATVASKAVSYNNVD